MNFKTIRVSDVLRCFADMLDNPTEWGKIRERDPAFKGLSSILREVRLYCRINTGVDLMPGVVKAEDDEPLVTNQPNKFQLPFNSREKL